MKNIIFADGQVGCEICDWLLTNYRDDIGLIITTEENEIKRLASGAMIPCTTFRTEQDLIKTISQCKNEKFNWGFLVWWPYIVSESVLSLANNGFINTHPSFLPFNRGKHYNFWAIVEQAPFGVSLHMVEKGIDCGDIVAQFKIDYGWEDTGATLYAKAIDAMPKLFKYTYPSIREGRIVRTPQELNRGSFHLARELDTASRFDLDAVYHARDFLNLLRARSFAGYPACSFVDEGNEYEVRVEIRKVNTKLRN